MTERSRTRWAGGVAIVLGAGAGALSLAHVGTVPRAAVALGVASVALLALGVGLLRQRPWARIVGLAGAALVVGWQPRAVPRPGAAPPRSSAAVVLAALLARPLPHATAPADGARSA